MKVKVKMFECFLELIFMNFQSESNRVCVPFAPV